MSEGRQSTGKFRQMTGASGVILKGILILIPIIGILFILDVHLYFDQTLYRQQYLAVFLGLVLSSIFLGVPMTKIGPRDHVPWYDLGLSIISLGIFAFNSTIIPEYVLSGAIYMGTGTLITAYVGTLIILEATRRMGGGILVVVFGAFLIYAKFSYFFPMPFYGKGVNLNQLTMYLFLDNDGALGLPLWVTGSIIFGFILFGQFLFALGGGRLLSDFSLATMGRYRGAGAKTAIIGSSLFGSISGSAVANVTATGTMTIPMMKESGYKPEVAGAIEAAASTGGQMLPPVMGVTAFIVAEILAVPYFDVAIAALIPALLFFIVLFLAADLEAAKAGLEGLKGKLPPLKPILKNSWVFLIPLIVLIYTLFILNFQGGRAAICGVGALFVFGLIRKETRNALKKTFVVLESTGRGLLEITVICATAGLVIGIIYTTGVGTTISHILLKIGSESLFLMLLFSAIVSIILGMGMPTSSVYIILAVLIAPAAVQAGILPMAAHLFIFYFGVISMITPPVCLASYAGAAIAGANPMRTGFTAVRFGIAAFIIPFIFVYTPPLLMTGNGWAIFVESVQALIGLGALSAALNGFVFRRMGTLKRIILGMASLCILLPGGTEIQISSKLINSIGITVAVVLILMERLKAKI